MKCLHCGKECFDDKYPEVVFKDGGLCVCEECSIDYEQKGKSFGHKSSQMNIHQNKVFDLMVNMWYNELENGKDFQCVKKEVFLWIKEMLWSQYHTRT